MATNSLGSLVVSLGLDAAEFTSGMTKAEFRAMKFNDQIGAGLRGAAAIGTVAIAGIGVAALGTITAIDTLVKKAADFQDLAEMTGASAEGLASFTTAADTAGSSVEAVAQASIKLTKNLTGVDDESKAAGAAISALGLNLKDFKALAPEDQISAISEALAGYADGAGKTAVANALFGKSGAELLPFLKALEEQGGRQVILTAEQIRLADEYADAQAKLRSEIGQYAQLLAVQALPAVSAFAGVLGDSVKEMFNAGNSANQLKQSSAIQDWAEGAAMAVAKVIDKLDSIGRVVNIVSKTIGGSAAQIAALVKGDMAAFKAIGKAYSEDVKGILGEDKFSDKLAKRIEDQRKAATAAANGTAPTGPTLPVLKFNGAVTGDKGAAAAKKMLDNTLKVYEDAAKREQDILGSRNRMLEIYNSSNLISTQDYYAGKRIAQEEALAAQVKIYDKEIAALEAYKSKTKKAEDKEAAQGKINDLLEKKATLTRDAAEAAIDLGFREQKSAEDLARQLNGVNAELLEMTGNLGAAARIRIGDQFKDLKDRLGANGDSAGLAQIGQLEKYKIAQADIGQQTEEVARITEGLRIQEERIDISRRLGADSELSALIKLGNARQGTVQQLESVVAAWEAIATASGNPAFIQNADRARLELEKLQAVANPLADKFNTMFTEGFGSAFGEFVNGTKTASEAFDSFIGNITSQLANFAAQEVAKQLFSGLLGGATGGAGGGGIGSFFASLFGGGKAVGGAVQGGSMYEVNERGPELLDVNGRQLLMMGSKSGKITPNNKLGGGNVYNINVSPPAGSNRQTALQFGETAGRQISNAQRRNG